MGEQGDAFAHGMSFSEGGVVATGRMPTCVVMGGSKAPISELSTGVNLLALIRLVSSGRIPNGLREPVCSLSGFSAMARLAADVSSLLITPSASTAAV